MVIQSNMAPLGSGPTSGRVSQEIDVEIGLQPQATPMLVNVGLNEREY